MPTTERETKKIPIQEPERDKPPVNIDPDDAMIEEPRDDVFEQETRPGKKSEQKRK